MTFLKTTRSKVIAALVIISLASMAYLFWQTKPLPLQRAPQWKGIRVGADTKDEILNKLGATPVSSTISATGNEILSFSSEHPYWPDQVYIQSQGQESTLVKERLLNTTPGELKTYIDKYGPPDAILASNDDLPALGFRLHVFPKAGLAVNANPNNGVVFEVWYFSSTTLAKFQTEFASEITVWTDFGGF